jgi:hypothetical protein
LYKKAIRKRLRKNLKKYIVRSANVYGKCKDKYPGKQKFRGNYYQYRWYFSSVCLDSDMTYLSIATGTLNL